MTLSVVVHGCETWSFTLREEHRLGMSQNRVLREVPGSKRENVIRSWGTLYYGELHEVYCSQILFTRPHQGRLDGRSMWHARGDKKCIQRCGEGRLRNNIIWKI